MFRKLLDAATNAAAGSKWGKTLIESVLPEGFETWLAVDKVSIDSKQQTIAAEVTLEGEPNPIHIKLHYTLQSSNNQLLLVPLRIEATRAWVELAANGFLAKRSPKLTVPTWASVLLGKFQ